MNSESNAPLTFDDLLYRLHDRYTAGLDEDALKQIENQITQDAPSELISFISIGIKRGDLLDDEVDAALDLARRNRLLKSSPYLAEQLAAIKAQRSAGTPAD